MPKVTVMRGVGLRERYDAKVDRSGGPAACWPWMAYRDPKNYGRVATGDATRYDRAHRAGYRLYVGPIPDGATIDHTCHNRDSACPGGNSCEHRACQNPAHWEAVSPVENTQRGKSFSAVNAAKTHCPRGHEYTPDNTYSSRNGRGRACRTCVIARARRQDADGYVRPSRRRT